MGEVRKGRAGHPEAGFRGSHSAACSRDPWADAGCYQGAESPAGQY